MIERSDHVPLKSISIVELEEENIRFVPHFVTLNGLYISVKSVKVYRMHRFDFLISIDGLHKRANYISVHDHISVLIEGAYSIFVYFDDHFCLRSCFFFQMLEKFAEDDRIEQMNAQKRRMKQLEHKRAVEKLIEERRIQFQRERVRRRLFS